MSENSETQKNTFEWAVPLGALGVVSVALYQLYTLSGAHGIWLIVAVAYVLLCLTAWLAMLDTPSRLWIAGTLRKAQFTQIYVAATRRRLNWLWERLCHPMDDKAPAGAILRATLTARLYDRALLIAVVYPLMFLVLWWIITGKAGQMGAFTVLPAAAFWPDRAIVFGALALTSAAAFFLRHLAASSSKSLLVRVMRWASIGFVFLIFPFIFLFVDTPGLAEFAIMVVGMVAVSYSVLWRGAGVVLLVGFAGAAFVAISMLGLLGVVALFGFGAGFAIMISQMRQPVALASVTIGLLILWGAAAGLADWSMIPEPIRGVFLFLAVFPLLNALFDTLSYAATLTLMRLGLRSGQPWVFGLLDFAVALGLFFALGGSLVAVIGGLNHLAGVAILDLVALFDGIKAAPGAYIWLYAMVFSTIVPTLLHAMISLLGFQGLVPRALRLPVAGWLVAAGQSRAKGAVTPLALGALWLAPFLALGLVGWGLWLGLGDGTTALCWAYVDALERLAKSISGA